MGENKQALLIKANGETSVINFTDQTAYEVISGSVGGYIQSISVEGNIDLWVNEEGKLNRLPYNHKATEIWKLYFGDTDVMSGDVVITGGADEDGNSNGLSIESRNKIEVLIGSVGEPTEYELARYEKILDFFA